MGEGTLIGWRKVSTDGDEHLPEVQPLVKVATMVAGGRMKLKQKRDGQKRGLG